MKCDLHVHTAHSGMCTVPLLDHVYSSLTGRRTDSDFTLFADFFPGVEVLNGQLLRTANRAANAFAARWGKAPLGGSDAHTLASLASAYTDIPSAASKQDYLAG